MINTAIADVKSRKYFYRDFYRKGLLMLIIILIIEMLLTIFMTYVVVHQHKVPAFYASSSDGILTKLKPMREPNYSQKALLD